jgi:ribose-phosphate pyrophosphokinase
VSVVLHGFADEAGPARRLAEVLGVEFGCVGLHEFPDGETLPTVPPVASTVLVYRSLDRPNPKLMPLMLACDAWRRAGARRLVLVAPYLSYLRQDAVFEPRQSLSRDVLGALLGPRFDRIVTVNPHLHRTADLSASWNTPVTVLSAAGALAGALPQPDHVLVVGPDEEAAAWASAFAGVLGAPYATLRKQRRGDRDVSLTLPEGVDLTERAVVLVDDVCSSGVTLERATLQLREAGAASVDVAVTHALFDQAAFERLKAAGARRIVSSDSCLHPTNAAPLAGLLAHALGEELSPKAV